MDNQEMYTVKDIQKIFGCGINNAYSIVHSHGFPKIKIGRQYFVPKKAFEEWVKRNIGKDVLL